MQIKKGGGWVDTQWADTWNNAAISLPLSPRSLWCSVNFIPVSINSCIMTPASECAALRSQTGSPLSISQWGSSASRQCVANLLIWSQQEWKSILRCLYNSSSLCRYGIQMKIIDSTFHHCLTYSRHLYGTKKQTWVYRFCSGLQTIWIKRCTHKKKKYGRCSGLSASFKLFTAAEIYAELIR